MDPLRQEALSHQHYGYWCVPLAGGAIAVFSHPNGRLLDICPSWEMVKTVPLPPRPVYPPVSPQFGPLDINLDGLL